MSLYIPTPEFSKGGDEYYYREKLQGQFMKEQCNKWKRKLCFSSHLNSATLAKRQFSNDCSAWDTVCIIYSATWSGVSQQHGGAHHLYTTTSAALPFILQSRSCLHKHPRISTCEGKVFMKQGNYATSLHLPLFLWALCSSSFLPSQENAVPVMEKCPTSTAHTGWVIEIGVSCFPSA